MRPGLAARNSRASVAAARISALVYSVSWISWLKRRAYCSAWDSGAEGAPEWVESGWTGAGGIGVWFG